MKKKVVRSKGGTKAASKKTPNGMIDFDYANISYQIDPNRRKVYRRWVEVETARTCLIMGAWAQTQGQLKRAV